MKRKSPIRHRVKSHTRKSKPVHSYVRGCGLPKPVIIKKKLPSKSITTKPKLKHFVVKYRIIWSDERTSVDTVNCFVKNKKDIVQDLMESHFGHIPLHKRPEIEIIKTTLQTPPKSRLRALLDVDNRTKSRMKRGYILDYVKISDIDLPPIRRQLRFEDNYKKMKKTKGMPPAHLHLMSNGRYKVDDGVHRIHAAKKHGYDSVPILIKYGVD